MKRYLAILTLAASMLVPAASALADTDADGYQSGMYESQGSCCDNWYSDQGNGGTDTNYGSPGNLSY